MNDARCTKANCNSRLDVGKDGYGIPYGVCPTCGAQYKFMYGEPRMVKS